VPALLTRPVAPPRRREARLLSGVLLLAQVPLVLLCAYLYAARTNTLTANGRWLATKATLERGVMGTLHFLNTPTSLARGRLQLGSWHGYQEVLFHRAVKPREVAFDFALSPNSYVLFVFEKTNAGFRALRLSSTEQFPSAYIVSQPDGEFISQARLPCGSELSAGRVELRFGPDNISARLDESALGTFAAPSAEATLLGFRGSESAAWIDNVTLHDDAGQRIIETFFNRAGFSAGLAVAAPGTVALMLLAGWVLSRRGAPRRQRFFVLLSATALLTIAVATSTVAHELVLVHAHVAGDPVEEERFRSQEAEYILREIRSRHAPRPRPGVTRLLFVGTSQTWGAGATRESDTFVRRLEEQLNRDTLSPAAATYKCINGGIMALTAPQLLRIYEDDWLSLKPDLVVVHLSNNDVDPIAFEEALTGFAHLARENHIATLFSLEANSIEHHPEELPLHPVMRRVAAMGKIPIVNVHQALKARSSAGLLWWDFVHPTSFGHRLIAEALWPVVAAQARARAAEAVGSSTPAQEGPGDATTAPAKPLLDNEKRFHK
jgi:lysophospholipase L1-like esterase